MDHLVVKNRPEIVETEAQHRRGFWRENGKWLLLIGAAVAVFFWKIVFTNQFSILEGWEGVNQAYAWYAFAVKTIQKGIFPGWNPYTLAGHPYLGEPQTSVFYPPKLLMYLAPLGNQGVLSPRVFHESYVLAHLLAAWFMFLLAKELGVRNNFAAFISAITFTVGGAFGRLAWVNLADSAVWLPLILLFQVRAMRSGKTVRRNLNACFSGLCMAMAILAGSLHLPLMHVLTVISAAAFFAFQPSEHPVQRPSLRSRIAWSAAVVFVIGLVSFCVSAPQLFPSAEYAPLARRWAYDWSGLFNQRIPYDLAGTRGPHLGPRAIFAFLFGAASLGGGEFSPYFGVLPFLLAIIGVWQNWEKTWVKFLAGLGVAALFYAMGDFSLFHGLMYLLPYMDKAWEAGRFVYLTDFAMAVLAGLGTQALFSGAASAQLPLEKLNRVLQWAVVVVAVALGVSALFNKPELVEWPYVSFFFLLASWLVFLVVIRGNRNRLMRFLVVAVILSDLYVFDWTIQNSMTVHRTGRDYLGEMMSMRPVAEFFKSQPGLFRVDMEGDEFPSSMGDVWGVQTTEGWGATMLDDYLPIRWSPHGSCLMNVRYVVGNRKDRTDTPIFTSGPWKVYPKGENCPRAWVVRKYEIEPSHAKLIQRIQEGRIEPLQTALMTERPAATFDPNVADSTQVRFTHYQEDGMDLDVQTNSRGLLILSEISYPGWQATVNGSSAHVYQVDGILRGLIVSEGENHISMRFRPRSVYAGIILASVALLAIAMFAGLTWRRERAHPDNGNSE